MYDLKVFFFFFYFFIFFYFLIPEHFSPPSRYRNKKVVTTLRYTFAWFDIVLAGWPY